VIQIQLNGHCKDLP